MLGKGEKNNLDFFKNILQRNIFILVSLIKQINLLLNLFQGVTLYLHEN